MKLYLKEPDIKAQEEIVEMCEEIRNSNDEIFFEGINNFKNVTNDNYLEFLQDLELNKHIEEIHPEYVNQTSYVLMDDTNHIYGAINLRHNLRGKLYEIGGNIGYAIRPTERGKGYAELALKLLLEKALEMNIDKVLLTCRETNLASKKTMNKFVGIEDTMVDSAQEGIKEYRYWIDVKLALEKYKINGKTRSM